MNLLAFDTSTDIMSIAVLGGTGDSDVNQHSAPGGAQTSTHLIPEIQRLMALAQMRFEDLDAIVFGAGPGSFTGLRTACSVAQGLALGVAVPVLPVDTLLAVAEEARCLQAASQDLTVTVLLDARMDEWYTARYSFTSGHWTRLTHARLIKPEDLDWNGTDVLAGNVFEGYGAHLPQHAPQIAALPTATALLRLAPALLASGGAVPAEQALPIYVRDKVAQTTLERMASKARVSA